MKKREAVKDAEDLIRLVAPILGVDDWLFYVGYDSKTDAYAECFPTSGARSAVIHIGPAYGKSDDRGRLDTIVHELLHCVHRDATEIIRCASIKAMTQVEYEILWECFRQQMELWTAHMAGVIVNLMEAA